MRCSKCDFDGNPNLEETGPHTKALCPKCGAYIKMVSKDELDAIIKASIPDERLTFVIKTSASSAVMPIILTHVRTALEKGFLRGKGIVSNPFDDTNGEEYEFYYK